MTEKGVRALLASGHRTSNHDFVEHAVEHIARTVYLMARFLANPQHARLNSRELQDRIDDRLRGAGLTTMATGFNPVDWFSAKWTQSKNGTSSQHFTNEYRELFVREDTNPYTYRINEDWYEVVSRILLELDSAGATVISDELSREGAFEPKNLVDARRTALRAIVIRQGQPRFRAELLDAYEGRCAVTDCDAAPALEAAHINPYDGVATNCVTNGILLRADVHTLFDLDLIAIDPKDWLVRVSNQLRHTVYWALDGTPLRMPVAPSVRPSYDAIVSRWKSFIGRAVT